LPRARILGDWRVRQFVSVGLHVLALERYSCTSSAAFSGSTTTQKCTTSTFTGTGSEVSVSSAATCDSIGRTGWGMSQPLAR
jgi:hypothetical protein